MSENEELNPKEAMRIAHWLVYSPPLWVESENLSSRLPQWWTEEHDDLSSWEGIAQINRIGQLAEEILARFISLSPDLSLLKKGLVIQGPDRTIGELDVMVETPQGIEHWELATKFYLHDPETDAFIGANGKDHLKRKLGKLKNHQLPLGRHPQVLEWCKERGLDEPTSSPLIKGRLFTKPGCDELSQDWLGELSSSRDVGIWIYQHELQGFIEKWNQSGHNFQPLSRREWLSSSLGEDQINGREPSDEQDQRSFQGFLFPQNESSGEAQRVCVVPEGWPDVNAMKV